VYGERVVKKAKKSRLEPFPEQTVIEWPLCGRIRPANSARVDKIGFRAWIIGGNLG
jgi:hypothetical protein